MHLFEISHAYKFLGGFYFALSVLHIVLFLYNPNKKANLIYAAGMFMVFINFTFTQQAKLWSGAYKINILTDLAANGALLFYVSNYVIARTMPSLKKPLQIFGWLYAGGFLMLVINFQLDIFNTPLEIVLRSAIYTLIGGSCILGLVKKLANFHLIVIATLGLMVTWVFFGTDLFNIWGGHYSSLRVSFVLLGFISPGVAYSYYLSKYLSRTKKDLVKEKIINEQLSFISLQAEKIQELNQTRSRFFANISHEFRTPLTLILGPLENKLKKTTNVEEQIELTIMHRNASRLLRLVNQLLDLSRLEAGTLKLKARPCDLNEVISSIASQFSSMANSKNIIFEIDIEEGCVVYVDTDKLEKIVSNLLSNAFKFTPDGGSIKILVKRGEVTGSFAEGYVELSVIDSGVGVEEAHLERIFERFYQADNSLTRQYEGSGIGLALTKELVELHHGKISVASRPGRGATFTVKLPQGEGHLLEDEIDRDPIIHLNGYSSGMPSGGVQVDENVVSIDVTQPRILVVEDNQDLRYYLKESLKNQFGMLEATDGDEGILMALRETPDLVISDLMMPKADGLQLCQQLKADEKTSHIPIILLTAKADVETKLQGYRQGADDYIAKPFQLEELRVRIENLLANRKRAVEKFTNHLSLQPSAVPVTSIDERFLKRAMEIVESFISDTSFGVNRFAEEIGVSHTQLYRKLHAITELSPNEFIRHMRLQRAADLMRLKAGNVAEITYMVGFNNLSYFSKVFKEKFGSTPLEFLKNPLPPSDMSKRVN